MQRLNGKVSLVTGAARGIGAATARRFVAEGATVLVTDIDKARGSAVAADLGAAARFLELDVARDSDWAAAMQFVLERHGRLHVLVNDAGITGFAEGVVPQDPENCSLERWRRVHEVNLDGVLLGCRHGIRAMKARGGAIVNVSSRSGLVGIPFAVAYASSKAAVRNHSKSVALYCAAMGYPIRCNSIHPAAILTPMWDGMLGEGPDRVARMSAIVADTPLRRFGSPDEVAAAIAYLASDEAGYTTGAELTIDGGLLAGSAATPKPS